jgi:hypothetical protein
MLRFWELSGKKTQLVCSTKPELTEAVHIWYFICIPAKLWILSTYVCIWQWLRILTSDRLYNTRKLVNIVHMYSWPWLCTMDRPVLSPEMTPHNDKTVTVQTKTKNSSWAAEDVRHQDWSSVIMWLWLGAPWVLELLANVYPRACLKEGERRVNGIWSACSSEYFSIFSLYIVQVKWPLVTTAWHVLGLRMEDTVSGYGG